MPRRTDPVEPPAAYVVGGFPDGRVRADAPVAAAYARLVALRLGATLAGANISHVCARAGVNRATVQRILAGDTWPELVTLAKLETTLGTRLWPTDAERTRLTRRR